MASVLIREAARPSIIICEAAGHSGRLRLLSVPTAKVTIYNLQQCFRAQALLMSMTYISESKDSSRYMIEMMYLTVLDFY